MAECKLKGGPTRPLGYFTERLDVVQKFLVTRDEPQHYLDRKIGVYVVPASCFLVDLV